MKAFITAFWAEALKTRRSKVSLLLAVVLLILPTIDGLFMFILKNPERARAMGLIGVKAQLTAGVADWPTFFQVLLMGTAIGGAILFAFITAWVFGREFSDHTVKEILASPIPRGAIVGAKFTLIAIWIVGLCLMIFVVGLGVGTVADIPGWSHELERTSFWSLILIGLLSFMLMPFVAFFASAGRGYLPPLGWAFLTMALAQIAIVLGWGDWFPWSVPGLLSSVVTKPGESVEMHSYGMVLLVFATGIIATSAWWLGADQAR
jgi:ABC-2 type transport system permease protein